MNLDTCKPGYMHTHTEDYSYQITLQISNKIKLGDSWWRSSSYIVTHIEKKITVQKKQTGVWVSWQEPPLKKQWQFKRGSVKIIDFNFNYPTRNLYKGVDSEFFYLVKDLGPNFKHPRRPWKGNSSSNLKLEDLKKKIK
jgi:hypothetical protein